MQFVFLLLITLGSISAISSQQCYKCTEADNGCVDPFNANALSASARENRTAGGVCMKMKLQTPGGTTIERSAASDTLLCVGGLNGCGEQSKSGVTVAVCCCTGDLCNGISRLRQQPLTIVLLTIITFAMFIYQRL